MVEDYFKSMVIMECYDNLVEHITESRELYIDQILKKDNIIYRNINVDVSDKSELINITIRWEELEKKDELIFDVNTLGEKPLQTFDKEVQIGKSKLCKINIWSFHPQSKFLFMFFHNTNLNKSSEVIKTIFGKLNVRRICLSNTFFDNLINYNNGLLLIGKTINIGFNYRNSFNNLISSKNEERIAEVKFTVNFSRSINVIINNKGIVKILNKPKFEEAYEIVEIINHTLIKVDSLGDLYCE